MCCVLHLTLNSCSMHTYTLSKPENIFIKNNQYKLGDFGLVSKIENHDDVEEGDSRYMSMELLSGDLDDLTKVRSYVPYLRGIEHFQLLIFILLLE